MSITKLAQLLEAVKDRPRRRLVAAAAHDLHTLEAIQAAWACHLVDATLVGDEPKIREHAHTLNLDLSTITILHEPDDTRAAVLAVEKIRHGEGHFLMKGSLQTATLMRAILHRDTGILEPGATLCHVALIECPSLDRLLIASDAAVIPHPDLTQKIAITHRVVDMARLLGIPHPRVALISITEQVNTKLQGSVDAATIAQMALEGEFPNAFVEGPLPLDAALDTESAEIKHVLGNVGGRADGLVFPDLEAGNIFYKACTKLASAEVAGLVMGAKVGRTSIPCVVSSRGDSARAKLYSIALAALASK